MTLYLLSLITGILECGWIAYGAVHSLPLWQILCYPLAYHIGNLFPKPFSLSHRCLLVMSVMSFVTSGLTLAKHLSESAAFVLTGASLFLLSAVIQSVRSGLKSDGNRLMKRIFRVSGFALAPLAAVFPSAILLISSAIAFCGLKDYHGNYNISRMGRQNGYSAVMIFHQLHYFFYAHITLAAMSLLLMRESSAGTVYAVMLFCGTWITYMSVEPIVSKLTAQATPVFYAGHIGISALLFVMHLVTSKLLFIALWLITGFGGGVVYTISAKAKADGSYNKDSMTVSENIGHTLGLLTAVCIAAADDSPPQTMLLLGSASALLAAVSMAFITRKEYHYENIHS
ncbi:MAG: hypothetical protein ACI4JA_04120 [Oscillospiraceae bacterium]